MPIDEQFMPPPHLLPRIGSAGVQTFIAEGANIKNSATRCLPPDLDLCGRRVLDFGCGVGRLLWHLEEESRETELWGCDIDEQSVTWVRERFGERFHVFQNTYEPPLEVESESFDAVVSTSVFTHIPDLWKEWLQEIRRILKPSGVALLSYQGPQMFQDFVGDAAVVHEAGFYVDGADNEWDQGGPQVYQTDEWIVDHWSPEIPVVALFPSGLCAAQSAAVLIKDGKVTAPYVAQPFAHHVGQKGDFEYTIEFDPYEAESWWQRAGCRDDRPVTGWILSKTAPIESLELVANGTAVRHERTPREDVAAVVGVDKGNVTGFLVEEEELRAHRGGLLCANVGAADGTTLAVEFQVAQSAHD